MCASSMSHLVAETDGPTMFARIGVMRALKRHHVREFNQNRNTHHWDAASARSMTRSEKDFASQVIWFLATIFPGYQASFGRNSTTCARQRLVGRLYPTGGVMRSESKVYRQRNHRPSCEHGNPVQHRDIMRRIWTQDTRYRRDMPVVVPSPEWGPPLPLTRPGIPMQVVVPSVS